MFLNVQYVLRLEHWRMSNINHKLFTSFDQKQKDKEIKIYGYFGRQVTCSRRQACQLTFPPK